MYKVVYLPTARQQLEDAVMYIAVDLSAPDAAMNLADEVGEAVQKLQEMPYRFPIYHTLYAMKHEIRFFPHSSQNSDLYNSVFEISNIIFYAITHRHCMNSILCS